MLSILVSVDGKMLNVQDIFPLIIVLCLVVWWKRKPLRDLAAQIPGYNGLPLIGIVYKFIGVNFEGLNN